MEFLLKNFFYSLICHFSRRKYFLEFNPIKFENKQWIFDYKTFDESEERSDYVFEKIK